MKRIRIPQPITVTLVDDNRKPVVDDSGNQKVLTLDMLWFVRPILEGAPAFANAGHRGFRSGSRIEDAIIAAQEAKADYFDLYEPDFEPLRDYVDTMTDHPAQKHMGRMSLRWTDPILNATDVPEEAKEAAE